MVKVGVRERCLFSNEPCEKRPVMTIENFVAYSDDHFESRLLGNRLYLKHNIQSTNTARSREDETRNARRNANRNPGWSKFRSLFKWAVRKESCDDHRGFRFAFWRPFRVSSSRERAVSDAQISDAQISDTQSISTLCKNAWNLCQKALHFQKESPVTPQKSPRSP